MKLPDEIMDILKEIDHVEFGISFDMEFENLRYSNRQRLYELQNELEQEVRKLAKGGE